VPFNNLVKTFAENSNILEVQKIDYKNVMSFMRCANEWIQEKKSHAKYLFLLEK